MKWQTPEELRSLLVELVSWKSITLSEGEIQFPIKLQAKLQDLTYFQKNQEYLQLHDADLQRKFLTALYKHPKAEKTICFISHFDTVNTDEYGDDEPLATQPEELTKIWKERSDGFSDEVNHDLESGEYLFGRGTMDMKMGLVMHMRIIEKASVESWPINILLLTVPDEEVNSSGMRHAVPKLIEIQKRNHLTYSLFLNSEPAFSQDPNDRHHYLYTGSIGKILAAALFYGKETHAGEPLRGMTSPFISSYLTKEMEWNASFQETVFHEKTPLPITLQQTDLRLLYSTQTPYRSSALYNIFIFKKNATEVFETFEQVAKQAAILCNQDYKNICKKNGTKPIGEVKVIKYKNLLQYAEKKFGTDFTRNIKADIYDHDEWDDREKSLRMTDRLMIHCQELAPTIVVLLAPPYYPAVNSSNHPLVKKCSEYIIERAKEKYQLTINQIHYCNGICDLSYVNFNSSNEGIRAFEENTPVWGETYSIPFEEMKKLQAPVLNIGPYGKDPHKRSERLHIQNAFVETPVLLEDMIKMIMNETSI